MGARCCKNIDLDEVFPYPTPKIVVIKDRYLGLLNLFFKVSIFVYIMLQVLFKDPEGYVETGTPIGVVRISVQRPTSMYTDSRTCTYCTGYNGAQGPTKYQDVSDCIQWDEGDAVVPIDQTNAAFITTRVTISDQARVCPANATVCQTNLWTNVTTPKDYYVLGADNFTILLSHSFQSTIKGQSGTSSNDMKGTLTAINSTVIKQFYGSAKTDYFSLDYLMAATGRNFNDYFQADPSKPPGTESLRHSGFPILLTITYKTCPDADPSCTKTTLAPYVPLDSAGSFQYQYDVRATPINYTDFKAMQYISNPADPNRRSLFNRHGLKIFVLFGGTLKKFSTTALLLQLVTSLGLLSVAALVVDSLMQYAMPLRRWYSAYKYQNSIDFEGVKPDDFDELKVFSGNGTFDDNIQRDLARMRGNQTVPLNTMRQSLINS